MIFDVIFITAVIILIMLVWFNSDAFIEYAKLVGGARFFEITEFENLQKEKATLDYHTYLLEHKDCFFIRLITCPLCFSVWVSIGVTLSVTGSILVFPICNVIAIAAYKLTSNLLES
jgi:hypothetical protein